MMVIYTVTNLQGPRRCPAVWIMVFQLVEWISVRSAGTVVDVQDVPTRVEGQRRKSTRERSPPIFDDSVMVETLGSTFVVDV
jgi:hypothetical protein